MVIGRGPLRKRRVHAAAANCRAAMRRCRKPITALRRRALNRSQRDRIVDDRGAIERRTQHRRVRDLAAQPAADAGVDHLGDRLGAQGIGVRRDGERRAARKPDARMIARAGIGIDAEALAHDAFAALNRLRHQRALAALLVQHAFRLRHDDLGAFLLGGQRLAQGVAHLPDIVGVRDGAHPLDADAAHRLLDRIVGRADLVVGVRRQHVLPAGRRGVAVVDDDMDVVRLVEHRVADRGGEPVVPEAAIAEECDRALVGLRVERGGARAAEAVAHGGRADVERRQDREQVAADVAA